MKNFLNKYLAFIAMSQVNEKHKGFNNDKSKIVKINSVVQTLLPSQIYVILIEDITVWYILLIYQK